MHSNIKADLERISARIDRAKTIAQWYEQIGQWYDEDPWLNTIFAESKPPQLESLQEIPKEPSTPNEKSRKRPNSGFQARVLRWLYTGDAKVASLQAMFPGISETKFQRLIYAPIKRGLIVKENNQYHLTSEGMKFAKIFASDPSLLKLGKKI